MSLSIYNKFEQISKKKTSQYLVDQKTGKGAQSH